MIRSFPSYGREAGLIDRLNEPEACIGFLLGQGFQQTALGGADALGVSLSRTEGMFRATLVIGVRTPPHLLFEVREHPSSRRWTGESSYLHKRKCTLGQLAYHAWTMMEAVAIP